MLELNEKAIRISRGDTAMITLTLSGDDLPEGMRALATLKKTPSASEAPIWEKWPAITNSAAVLSLGVEDTNLEPGTYWWDLRLILATGEVRTPFAPQKFEVMKVVGDIR